MYIEIEKKYKCTKCGCISKPKIIYENNDGYYECISCGHKSIYFTIKFTPEQEQIVYDKQLFDSATTY